MSGGSIPYEAPLRAIRNPVRKRCRRVCISLLRLARTEDGCLDRVHALVEEGMASGTEAAARTM
eukprot:3751397-Pleurochrysis_carterae.AAC.2